MQHTVASNELESHVHLSLKADAIMKKKRVCHLFLHVCGVIFVPNIKLYLCSTGTIAHTSSLFVVHYIKIAQGTCTTFLPILE
jgi:hypothetical protein